MGDCVGDGPSTQSVLPATLSSPGAFVLNLEASDHG